MPEVLQQMLNYVIAIYIRLSAEDGDLSDEKNESNSVVNQRAYIRRFIELRPEFAGAQILEFCDDGYSGTNMERPAVRRLLEQVRQRKINCIIVKDMSRFGRDYIVVGDYLEQIFPFLDVRFIAINDSYDSKDHKYGSAGLIDVSFRNVIYDLYSKDLSEKVRSTKKQLAEKGYCVAPYAFFGYQKAPGNKHTLLVDEDAAAVVRRVFDLFTSGLSTTEIARKFNTEGVLTPLQRKRLQKVNRRWNCVDQSKNYWTSAMVRKILDDERYTGKAIYGKTTRKKVGSSRVKAVTEDQWTVVDGAFPAIITQEIFNTAKSLNRNSHPGSAGESTRVFYRKIRCGHCGLAMERLQSAHPCYVCRTDRYKPDIGCPQDRIDEKELEQTVLAAIRMMAQLVRGAVQAKQRQSAKDSLQLHFIRLRPFRGQDILPLDVAVHHEDGGGVVVHLADDAGQILKPRQFAAVLAAVSRHDLISAVLAGADDGGDEYAVLPDALRRFLHGLVVPHLEGVVGEVVQPGEWNMNDHFLLWFRLFARFFLHCFFRHCVPPVGI